MMEQELITSDARSGSSRPSERYASLEPLEGYDRFSDPATKRFQLSEGA